MFLEKRVYQGSSGKVYPLPFIDRIAEEKTDRKWDAVHLENEFIRVMILPEIGGRIHVGEGRKNGKHGVCLHPGKAFIKKARVYNRTPLNVADRLRGERIGQLASLEAYVRIVQARPEAET